MLFLNIGDFRDPDDEDPPPVVAGPTRAGVVEGDVPLRLVMAPDEETTLDDDAVVGGAVVRAEEFGMKCRIKSLKLRIEGKMLLLLVE